ncbi:MAG: hypothetical protein K2X50_03680 [Gammaproteobacteria bacterium]|nr:hypothetical protein [Gammaproteobacteria bacterium]
MRRLSSEEQSFKEELNKNRGNINWELLISLWPKIPAPNSTDLSSRDATEPTALFLLAERADDSERCKEFINLVLNDPRIDFTVRSPMFRNTAFLWAISRYQETLASDLPQNHNVYFGSTSDLYSGIHDCPVFIDALFKKICENKNLHPLLTQQSTAENVCNTPLLMAVKNYNLNFAMQLVPFYDADSLLIKTIAGNTVLHLLALFRQNKLIEAIINHVNQHQGERAVTQLLSEINTAGKTPAQCYQAEKLPLEAFKDRALAAQVFKIGGMHLHRGYYDPQENWDNLAALIMELAFVRLNGAQEGAHRYSTIGRNEKSESTVQLLKAQDIDASYTNLDALLNAMFLSAEKSDAVEGQSLEKKITFSFINSNYQVKDADKRYHLMQALTKVHGHKENTHILIYDFSTTNEPLIQRHPNAAFFVTCYINPCIGNNSTVVYSVTEDFALKILYNPSGDLTQTELDKYNSLPKIELTVLEEESYSSNDDLDEVSSVEADLPITTLTNASEEAENNTDYIIIGGGPIGLAHACAIKKLNPQLEVIVFERHEVYQRAHTLRMEHKHLTALINAADARSDEDLVKLEKRLIQDQHIRTTELENTLKAIAQKDGVKIIIEKINGESLNAQIARQTKGKSPRLIIGADGTRSVTSNTLFPKGNQVKHEFDFALQLRFEIEGDQKATAIPQHIFVQEMIRQCRIANENVGHFENGKTPVTLLTIITKEEFELLKHLTSRTPSKPFVSKDQVDDLEEIEFQYQALPDKLGAFINGYLNKERMACQKKGLTIDENSIRISVNETPATHAQAVYTTRQDDHAPVLLVGDAALGLSYFKGLNAGIEATAIFISQIAEAIKENDPKKIALTLAAYQEWFLNNFAPRKVHEVAEYSRKRIRRAQKAVESAQWIKNASFREHPEDNELALKGLFDSLRENTRDSIQKRKHSKMYPHRAYDPVKFGQFSTVPLRHTFKKVRKLFVDFIKPYHGEYQISQDFKLPLVGVAHAFVGPGKLIVGFFTLSPTRFADGLLTSIRSLLEIALTPFSFTIKPIFRTFLTFILPPVAIENSPSMKKLAELGLSKLEEDQPLETLEKVHHLLAIANDLHRKYRKGVGRHRETRINLRERAIYNELNTNAHLGEAAKQQLTQSLKEFFKIFISESSDQVLNELNEETSSLSQLSQSLNESKNNFSQNSVDQQKALNDLRNQHRELGNLITILSPLSSQYLEMKHFITKANELHSQISIIVDSENQNSESIKEAHNNLTLLLAEYNRVNQALHLNHSVKDSPAWKALNLILTGLGIALMALSVLTIAVSAGALTTGVFAPLGTIGLSAGAGLGVAGWTSFSIGFWSTKDDEYQPEELTSSVENDQVPTLH